MKTQIDPGVKINMLTVLGELAPRIRTNGKPRRILLCRCDCGNEKEILYQTMSIGRCMSCGCHQKKVVREGAFAKTHGLSNHPLFTVWKRMIDRCYSPNHNGYKYYGGRGISICKSWKKDAITFVSWGKKNGWAAGLQIDRINCNGNYTPQNCRFVTPYENIMNRRCTKR